MISISFKIKKKFEGQSRINEIEIEGTRFSGLSNVVKAFEEKIMYEVGSNRITDYESPPTTEEQHLLDKLSEVDFTEEKLRQLTSPTEEDEIEFILKNEVDLDSSPGEDGFTYRFIKKFWKWTKFRDIYLAFLNYTRDIKSLGVVDNVGIMTVKNKKNSVLRL